MSTKIINTDLAQLDVLESLQQRLTLIHPVLRLDQDPSDGWFTLSGLISWYLSAGIITAGEFRGTQHFHNASQVERWIEEAPAMVEALAKSENERIAK